MQDSALVLAERLDVLVSPPLQLIRISLDFCGPLVSQPLPPVLYMVHTWYPLAMGQCVSPGGFSWHNTSRKIKLPFTHRLFSRLLTTKNLLAALWRLL